MRFLRYTAAIATVCSMSLAVAAPTPEPEAQPGVKSVKPGSDAYTRRKNGKMRDAGSTTKYFRKCIPSFYGPCLGCIMIVRRDKLLPWVCANT
jgi:hypothetical protein